MSSRTFGVQDRLILPLEKWCELIEKKRVSFGFPEVEQALATNGYLGMMDGLPCYIISKQLNRKRKKKVL